MMSGVAIDLKEKWTRVSSRLRAELGEDLFTSWFARMEPEELHDGRFAVSVPTRFLKSWIETHYIAKLHKTSEAEFGRLDTVQVRVRTRGLVPRSPEPAERRGEGLAPVLQAAPQAAAAITVLGADRVLALDPTQTFDNFVVGGSNQLAHAAACRVADAQVGSTVSFNPLFIHAGAGLGKTHLLNAVGNRICEKGPGRRVLFMTAERFMYSFVVALRQRDTISFKDQFQATDVLLIDDFQFLQGKTMQAEFCHAFNSLVDLRRQVIIAADVPPAQLDAIDQRMRSRLMGGLVIDIEIPDLELRRRIVMSRYAGLQAKAQGIFIPDEVLEFIANKITGGGRELEGALNRVIAYQQFNHQPITLDLASMVLRDLSANPDQCRVKIDDILKIVGRHYNVARTDLLSRAGPAPWWCRGRSACISPRR